MLGEMPRDGALRVLVFTAPVGDGHVAAARALAHDVRQRDPTA